MDLILGGAFQGKLTWAAKRFGFSEGDVFDLATGIPDKQYPCFIHLEAYTKAAYYDQRTADEALQALRPFIGNSVIISREISSGIVPMDKDERLWRELHGCVLRRLTDESESVTRIFCGLAEVLK